MNNESIAEKARQVWKDDLEFFGECDKVGSCAKWDNNKTNILRPLKAIREKCLDCCAGDPYEVALCTCRFCALFPYRFGKIPGRTRKISAEERAQKVEWMREVGRNQ